MRDVIRALERGKIYFLRKLFAFAKKKKYSIYVVPAAPTGHESFSITIFFVGNVYLMK